MRKSIVLCIFAVVSLAAQGSGPAALHEEDRELYDKFFEQAALEFGVPAGILQGLSFSETRWTHMKWEEGDTNSSCNGMPRVYGVMGLWDNSYFGHSLRDAAAQIGRTPRELKESPLQNIRGAAALLKKYYDELPKPEGFPDGSIESWQNAIARFSGIPQQDIAHRRGGEVYSILSNGYERDGIRIDQQLVQLEKVQSYIRSIQSMTESPKQIGVPDDAKSQPDYPLAKWNPARTGFWSTTLIQQKFVVVHDVEGSYLGCVSWFQNPSNPYSTSAHYVLNSHPNGVNSSTKAPNNTPDAPVGEITQMVEERYRAHHVGCWNSYMIGIEHEGYASVSGWYTPECYSASSKLVKYLCDKYNIPKDRNHVIAHGEHQNAAWKSWVNSSGQGFDPTCNTHTDPGPFWTWTQFMQLVSAADTIRPVIVSALPQSSASAFPAYKPLAIEFNTPMDITSANAAFSIAPNIAGTKSWSDDNKVLTFDPAALLPWGATFTITIDTSAKNIAKSRNLGTVPFVKSFTVVPLDTVGPAVIRSYPSSGETGVSIFTDVVIDLDEPVLSSSLSTTVKLFDANNSTVALANAKNEIVMDKGIISFSPYNLQPNKTYTMKLLAGMKDTYGNTSKTDHIFQFTTSPDVVTTGTPLDNLDANTKGWQQPHLAERTRSIDSAKTGITFTTEKIKAGGGSAKLAYAFTAADSGAVEFKATGFPPIDFYTTLGLWVAGDASNNSMELRIAPNDQVLNIGTITWRGWKFVQFPVSSISGANKILKSLIIRQQPDGQKEGKMFVDEMQVNSSVTAAHDGRTASPNQFELGQNYPNPFNPVTMITFAIPRTAFVSLKVYDMLGREIASLVDDVRQAGSHGASFDASRISSGVYYYTFRSGEFTQTRSMVLIK